MPEIVAQNAKSVIGTIVKEEWGRVLSALTSICGDIDVAEEALQDALVAALKVWPVQGVPVSPRGWLLTTARRRAIDRFRREARAGAAGVELRAALQLDEEFDSSEAEQPIPDERLKLIFTCCHPALSLEAQVALTLRTVGGISTPEIARAFVVTEKTMAQRLVRAKRKIRAANIPYAIPDARLWPLRIRSVLAVIYLIFNEGYAPTSGADLIRKDLCKEAIRLGGILLHLLPGEAEVRGLLALMLLHDARLPARCGAFGALMTLETQDRDLWDRLQIERGVTLLIGVLARGKIGPYQVQAAISAAHSEAAEFCRTDWDEIQLLYKKLYELQPSPIVALNAAVATSFAQSPVSGLSALAELEGVRTLQTYAPFHAARADMFCRAGKKALARQAYKLAVKLTENQPVKKYLRARLADLGTN